MRPVPISRREPDFSGIPIVECHEPVIELQEAPRLFVRPAYFERGFATAQPVIRIRAGLAVRLRRVAASLPTGLSLLVWDALRPLSTQREIADRFREELVDQGVAPSTIEQTVLRYVSAAPGSPEELAAQPSPHATGGAVDLTLADDDGVELDLGAAFDEFRSRAWLGYYERAGRRTASAATRRHLRRVLYNAMIREEFVAYPFEYWHYECGTRRAATRLGRRCARYGAAVRFEE